MFLLFTFFILAVFFRQILGFITDYQWFSELGYNQVFLTKLKTQLKLGIPIFLIATFFYYVYLIILKKDYYKKNRVYEVGSGVKIINKILMISSIFMGFITTTSIVGKFWFDLLTLLNAEEFNLADPIFNKDISFYIFKLTVIENLLSTIVGLLVALVMVTFVFYLIMFVTQKPTYYESEEELKWNKNLFKNFTHLGLRQLTIIGVVFFLVMAANFYLSAYHLLYSPTGAVYGAGYTDIHVSLTLYRVQMVLALFSAVAIMIGYFKRFGKKLYWYQ